MPGWLLAFFLVVVSSWGGNQFSPLMLEYQRLDHYSPLALNVLLGVYVLGLAPGLFVAGPLSDRYGRRPTMMASVLGGIIASALLSMSELGPALIVAGRIVAGVAVGIAMAAGNTWIKELSESSSARPADEGAGARRASLALTLGSAAGAGVAGMIAQITPYGRVLPYIIHIVLTVPFLFIVARFPETAPRRTPSLASTAHRRPAVPRLATDRCRRPLALRS